VYWDERPPTNGREFDASDVMYNFERGLRLDRSYLNITMTQAERPLSMEQVDKWTVKVVMPAGKAGKWLEQSGELMVLMPRECDEEWGDMNDWTRVRGTGPFTIKDFVSDSSLTLERKTDYWRNDPVHPENQLPYVDEVKVQIITDLSTRIAALRTAKIDVYGTSYDNAEDIIDTMPILNYVEIPGTTPPSIFMDLTQPPFDDIRVRRALQIGLDQKAITDLLYSGHAEWYGFPLLNMPEHSDMWTPLEEMPDSVQELFGYDVEKAKALLAEAGYPNGFKTKVIFSSASVPDTDQATIVQDYWSKIGVELELAPTENSVFNSLITSKTYDGMAIRSLSGSSTAHKMYTYRGGREGPVENLSFIDDPLMDETYEEMLQNYFDKPTFRKLFADIVPYIMDQVWMIQLSEVNGFTFWWPWLKGYSGENTVGYYDIYNWPIYTWIDQDLKKEMGY
jgi:peptide/nickel transport system substrate-binding protein